jgi:hypothetical protein
MCQSPGSYGLQILGVARGLEYLHRMGVVHGDLKPVRTRSYFLNNIIQLPYFLPLLCLVKRVDGR